VPAVTGVEQELAENAFSVGGIEQGLKPPHVVELFGTTEVVPCYKAQ